MLTKQGLLEYFKRSLTSIGRHGDIRITKFSLVYRKLMPVQQEKLRKLCGENFRELPPIKMGGFLRVIINSLEFFALPPSLRSSC